MTTRQRNISVEIPKCLLEQIASRAAIHGRSRNGEYRYLVRLGLEYAGDEDTIVALPSDGEVVKTTARMSEELEAALLNRVQRFERGLGPELVRMMAYAIHVRTEADLKMIADVIARQGREAAEPPPPAPPALPLD